MSNVRAGVQNQGTAGSSSSNKGAWELTGEGLEKLLATLDTDPTRAGMIYEEMRVKLMWFLERHGCKVPEEYADRAINILATKLGRGDRFDDVCSYALGIAGMLLKEMGRKPVVGQLGDDEPSRAPTVEVKIEREELCKCLRKCLGELAEEERALFLSYYEEEGPARIAARQRLAKEFGCTLNKLRIDVCRMNVGLRACISECAGLTDVSDRSMFIVFDKGGPELWQGIFTVKK